MLVSTTLAFTAVSLILSFLFSYVIVQNVDGEFLRIFKSSNTGQVDNKDAKINTTIAPRDTTVMNQTVQPQGEVKGRFVNPESGIEVTFPNSWKGIQNKNNIGATQVALLFGENSHSTNPEEAKPAITLVIAPLNSSKDERFGLPSMKEFSEGIKNSPKSNETNPAAPAGLKKVSFQNMKIGGYPAIRAEYQIPFPFNPSTMVKTTTVIFDTEKSEITFGYSSASSSNYKKYLPQFDKVIRSIKFGQGTGYPIDGGINSNILQSKSGLTKSIDNVTSPSTENQSPLIESQSRDNASIPPTAPGSADDKQKLFLDLLTGSNPGFRGADQAIYVNVLDYSSRAGIAGAKIAGVMVGGSGAADFIKNANSTKLLDVGPIDGQKFTGITDNNGQFSYTTRIYEDLQPGPIALIITVEADGYEPLSKIATFKLE
jgi:hypothetical protein